MRLNSFIKILTLFLTLFFSPLKLIASKDCEHGPSKWSDLDFVHVKLSSLGGKCIRVEGPDNDTAATKACKGLGTYIINPGNPQYIDPPAGKTWGTLGANNLNYYFCLSGANFNKRSLCDKLKNERPDLKIEFVAKDGKTDGDCMCGSKASTRLKDCSQSIPEPGADEERKKCEAQNATYAPAYSSKEKSSCVCLSDSQVIYPEQGDTCKVKAPTVAHEPGTESPEVVSCVSEFENKFKECKSLGESTAATCDQTKESNKSVEEAKKYVSTISQLFIQRAAGSGAKAQCAGASILGSGTFQIMNQLKASCDKELIECKATCNEIKSDVIAYCKGKIPTDADEITKKNNEAYLAKENTRLTEIVEAGKKLCLGKAVEKQDLLKDALNAYDSAAKSGATCACQLSSSAGNVNCATLPSPADCQLEHPPEHCSGVGLLICAPGSEDYATQKCQCLRDGTLLICKSEEGKVPFAFASDLKTINAGGGASGIGGGGAIGDMDLGGLNQASDARTDDKAPQGAAPGFGSASGSPGGGGGGSGGGGDGAHAAAEPAGEASEKNLGLFGLAKSALSNMFGKGAGSAAGKEGRNKNSNGIPDTEKWRPRGLASTGCKGSQIRCKNETIWEIMNNRYENSNNSFIHGQ